MRKLLVSLFVGAAVLTLLSCGCSQKPPSRDDFLKWENDFFEEVNLARRMAGINGLTRDERLDSVATVLARRWVEEEIGTTDLATALEEHLLENLIEAAESNIEIKTSSNLIPYDAREKLINAGQENLLDPIFEAGGIGIAYKRGVFVVEFLVARFADTTLTGELRPTITGELWPAESLLTYEEKLFLLVNEARHKYGASTLKEDLQLKALARVYAEKMLESGFFGHDEPSGKGLKERILGSNMDNYSFWGENLASLMNPRSPAVDAHQGLMNSPGHRENILRYRFTHMGIGAATDGKWWIFVQLFGEKFEPRRSL